MLTRETTIRRTVQRAALRRRAGRAVTLVELLVSISIIVLIMSVVTLGFRKLTDASALTTAVSTLTNYAAVARAYAIENQLETMLVVNPVNGRLELWHLNRQPGNDPLSQSGPNGYAYAPVLDSSAVLPLSSSGKPLVTVHPLDYNAVVDNGNRPLRDTADDPAGRNRDNLNWVTVCFDAQGRLVSRMRRIATRVDAGNPASPLQDRYGRISNRRVDGNPDSGRFLPSIYEVFVEDTLLTSAPGFIVSDRQAYEQTVGRDPPPADIVNVWLARIRPNNDLARFARQVVLNPASGRQLVSEIR